MKLFHKIFSFIFSKVTVFKVLVLIFLKTRIFKTQTDRIIMLFSVNLSEFSQSQTAELEKQY